MPRPTARLGARVRVLGTRTADPLRSTVARWLRTPWGRALAGVLALAVTGAAGLWLGGGLRTAEVREDPVRAGERIDLGPVRATVLDHAVTDEVLESQLELEGGDSWLAVRLVVEAAEDETRDYLPDILELPDGVEVAAASGRPEDFPREFRAADGIEFPQVHPGLPEEILLLWPVVGDVPSDLEVTVLGSEQYLSIATQELTWDTPRPVELVRVPRTDRLPAAFVERHHEEDA